MRCNASAGDRPGYPAPDRGYAPVMNSTLHTHPARPLAAKPRLTRVLLNRYDSAPDEPPERLTPVEVPERLVPEEVPESPIGPSTTPDPGPPQKT